MDLESVPQEGNATLGGHRKAMYAKDANGRMVIAPSAGWEAEEIVTSHAVEALQAQAEQARERVKAGMASPLEFWMYERRMDVALLSQTRASGNGASSATCGPKGSPSSRSSSSNVMPTRWALHPPIFKNSHELSAPARRTL